MADASLRAAKCIDLNAPWSLILLQTGDRHHITEHTVLQASKNNILLDGRCPLGTKKNTGYYNNPEIVHRLFSLKKAYKVPPSLPSHIQISSCTSLYPDAAPRRHDESDLRSHLDLI